jgi:hypothetical protein
VQECFKRLEKDSLVWAAGTPAGLPILQILGAKAELPDESHGILTAVKAFSAGLKLDTGVTLRLDVQGTDEEAARQMAEHLKKQQLRDVKWTVFPPPAGRDWVQVQARMSVAALPEMLARLGAVMPGGKQP